MLFTLLKRELYSLFLSPVAWLVLAIAQALLSYLFLAQVEGYLLNQAQLAQLPASPGFSRYILTPWFNNAAIVLMLVIPLVTMRVISEERRQGSLTLLLAAPVSATEIILGKYFGVLLFIVVMVLLFLIMPLTLLSGGLLDLGLLVAGGVGLIMLAACFVAFGLYMSSLNSSPAVAAVAAVSGSMLLWVIDWSGGTQQELTTLMAQLSLLRHFEPLMRGIVDSRDLGYFLLFSVFFLTLTTWRIAALRRG